MRHVRRNFNIDTRRTTFRRINDEQLDVLCLLCFRDMGAYRVRDLGAGLEAHALGDHAVDRAFDLAAPFWRKPLTLHERPHICVDELWR